MRLVLGRAGPNGTGKTTSLSMAMGPLRQTATRHAFQGIRADDGIRTHDLLHGKQMLYQLSYIRPTRAG